MASEPSSATIASEPLTSTSEIQTDTSEPSQLKYLPKSNPKIPISIVCCVRLRTPFPPP
ncbi:6460_t:CDS:2, partial [Funneliformis mosseae]